uniref:Uncharacterized protein n=1 Tax=viral metagenome TaxID=1070528 RepID=A0A6M3JXY1_9ZZZZ
MGLSTVRTTGDWETALINFLSDFGSLTTFSQEVAAATDVNGTTWKDLLDKSTLTKNTRILAFKVTVAGSWAGKAKVRIVDGDGDKIWPSGDEVVEDTDFVSATQYTLADAVMIPALVGYKVQFRSSNVGDGAGDTLQLNNLDIVSFG